jgi:7,8-dihydroneopterin 2',3'-cyclic phosphate phosphodiesterase
MARDYFKEMLKLAEEIKDRGLREKVVELLKNPVISNKSFRYKALGMEEAPASIGWHHTEKGGLAKHNFVVTRLCMNIANVIEKNYAMDIDRDTLIAGALLHDVAKLFEMKREDKGFDSTDISIDHIIMGASELYARGFPESVVHMVASHFGEQGTTAPQSIEAPR